MRHLEKTGKIADARRAVESARLIVAKMTKRVFDESSFEENVRRLNHAKVDLARKEERLRALQKKMY